MIVVQILLGLLALVAALGFSVSDDPATCLIAAILALGFLGLTLRAC